jgi:hypothetical protein
MPPKPPPVVGNLIVQAFTASRSSNLSIGDEWIKASFKGGGQVPNSAMFVSIQRLGELDLLCRAIEDELMATPPGEGQPDSRYHYLMLLSELWIGAAYAISYAFSDRGVYKGDQDFEAVHEDLRLVRVQLEKHQIPSDRKLDKPLDLVTAPGQPGPVRTFQYDKKDRLRGHIGRTGMSSRWSSMWEVIDVKNNTTMRWLERRSLADGLLKTLLK